MAPVNKEIQNVLKSAKQVSSTTSKIRLLTKVLDSDQLLKSKIISSVLPTVGKKYCYRDLSDKADLILEDCRIKLLKTSVLEAERSLSDQKNSLKLHLEKVSEQEKNPVSQLVKEAQEKAEKETLKSHEKKVNFFLGKKPTEKYPVRDQKKLESRKKDRLRSTQRKSQMRKNWKRNKGAAKKEALKKKVEMIKASNIVVNLSQEEIPDLAYIYLANGLKLVESNKVDKEDLRFDLNEFIRKMAWKAYFKEQGVAELTDIDIHKSLRVKSNNHPEYSTPLFEEIKLKIQAWLINFNPVDPKTNISPQAARGRKWIKDSIKSEKIFVTRADKGGAIIILDYKAVIDSMEKELGDPNKFKVISNDPEKHRVSVTKEVRVEVNKFYQNGSISVKDRELITGLNAKGNMKHNPEYRPVDPTIYPLFKLHKLSSEQIRDKVVPPARSVNNTKNGPLYRLEKWMSPHLTDISKQYCKDEYIKDTDEFLEDIKKFNHEQAAIPKAQRQKFQLGTLDVTALYPSIRTTEALKALQEAFKNDTSTSSKVKEALLSFSKLLFEKSYVKYKDKCYQPLVGIPTGGCNSRQTADCLLHYLMDMVKGDIPTWNLVKRFKRFIDDIFTVWLGTKRQFDSFVARLNQLSGLFGIAFGDWSFGSSVNFLDVTLFIDSDGFIQYRLFKKPTDSRLYLKTNSFHPRHVFDSVAFSQLKRVMRRNSTPQFTEEDVSNLVEDLVKCGYHRERLNNMVDKLKGEDGTSNTPNASTPSLVLVVPYFQEIDELKILLRSLHSDIKILIGEDTQTLVAARKGRSVASVVVKNNQLCANTELRQSDSQRCGSRGCLTCQTIVQDNNGLCVSGKMLPPSTQLNCKSSNVIYLAQCTLCDPVQENGDINCYAGQTIQPLHKRVNGHRSCFDVNADLETWEKSALSKHAFEAHQDNFDIKNFKFMAYKQGSGTSLNRLESKTINELRLGVLGLNRMKIQKE